MKEGAWRKRRILLEQREQLRLNPPSDYKERIKELDEALVAEDSRHQLAVEKFKIRRRTWRKSALR